MLDHHDNPNKLCPYVLKTQDKDFEDMIKLAMEIKNA